MKIITAFAVGLALVGALPATPASALNARSFVSGHGNDANICTYAAPCRTFVGAYAKTTPSGEISVLDPAGYGPLTITTALSIVNDGVGESSIVLIAAGNAITISAGVDDVVSLRGLTLDGSGVGTNGIQFNTGASLTVTNCVIRHVTGQGIGFFPNATSNLRVSNSLVEDNGFDGIRIQPTGSGTVTAVFNRVEVNNNSGAGITLSGLSSTGTIKATVSDSVAAHNGNVGFFAQSFAGQAPATLTVFHSVSANNVIGIVASGTGATLRLAQSEVTGNSTNGWNANNTGVIASYGDNYIDGNGTNTGSLTSIGKQ